ncbi:hypothetical protein [Rhodoferax sp.]|uniref:hypothetical protein n=1 Tax=Rhodoferax sp. TaxID=50421 RepID=UPI0025E2ACC8|nr:hypothetical protein [Rhodoferax sp.]MCM2340451.1 hypothetical protein [Rhodoferax sp.]
MKFIYVVPLLGTLLLTGCGGGGGDPGTCSGSPQWCAETGGVGSAQIVPPVVVSTTFVRVPDSDVLTVTCPDILALNNGDKVAAEASAQGAYQRGNVGLDGDKDGFACNGVF